MTKDVLISISGLQFGESNEADKVEIITPGTYYKKNNYHYVMYEEVVEGETLATKNLIKFNDEVVSLTKRGYSSVDMHFEKNRRNMTNYITPYGSLLVGIDAENIKISETEDLINIDIDYSLDINYQHLAECKINMDIMSKTEKSLDNLNL